MRPARRILITDDHPLFREALRHVIERVCPGAQYVEAASCAQMIEATAVDGAFDIIFLDLMMPGGDMLAELVRLRRRIPLTPVVVVSAREDGATIEAARRTGIAGYIRKTASRAEMQNAIARALETETVAGAVRAAGDGVRVHDAATLTPRQAAVLEKLWEGKSNRQIATLLGIEEITVKVHISAILRKLGVKTRLAAVAAAREMRDGVTAWRDAVR